MQSLIVDAQTCSGLKQPCTLLTTSEPYARHVDGNSETSRSQSNVWPCENLVSSLETDLIASISSLPQGRSATSNLSCLPITAVVYSQVDLNSPPSLSCIAVLLPINNACSLSFPHPTIVSQIVSNIFSAFIFDSSIAPMLSPSSVLPSLSELPPSTLFVLPLTPAHATMHDHCL